ncbi:MAG: hypothetical protein U0354_14845 [Candidatus Sericytochromatia bacterium]
MEKSKLLTEKEIKSLERLGDIIVPNSEDFPSFSQLGCIEHIDDIVSYAPVEDIKDLKMLLNSLSIMPDLVLKKLVSAMQDNTIFPEFISINFRLLDTAIRGIIFTLYYSGKVGKSYNGKNPLEIIDYSINRF